MTEARLYGANPKDGVGGTGSVFLLLDEPEVYGLPPDPQVPTKDAAADVRPKVGIAAAGMVAAMALVLPGRRADEHHPDFDADRPPGGAAASTSARRRPHRQASP